jgi:polar amino acid transport system substrate-binding protein
VTRLRSAWKSLLVGGLVALVSGAAVSPTRAQETLERIKAQKTARIGLSNFAPTSFVGADGEVTGVSPELAKAFLKSLGADNVEGVVGEFGSLIGGLEAGRFDMIAVAMQIQPKRCEQIAFGNPELQFLQGFVVKTGNPFDLRSFKDIAANPDARLGLLTGAGQIRFADLAGIGKDQQVLFPDFEKAVAGLQAGRVEAVTGAGIALKHIVQTLGQPDVEFVELEVQPSDENGKPVIAVAGMGFRKADNDLREAWNAWFHQARQSGEALKIVTPFGIAESDIPGLDVTAASICP